MTYLNDDTATTADDCRIRRLASHLRGFEVLLCTQEYAPASVRRKIDFLIDFSRWVERHNVPLDTLRDGHADQFTRNYRRRSVGRGDAWTIRQFIGHLRDIGCIPALSQEVDASADGESVRAFGEFLRAQHGLSASTVTGYLPIIWYFLANQFHGQTLHLNNLRAVDVHRFIVQQARRAPLRMPSLWSQRCVRSCAFCKSEGYWQSISPLVRLSDC